MPPHAADIESVVAIGDAAGIQAAAIELEVVAIVLAARGGRPPAAVAGVDRGATIVVPASNWREDSRYTN